MLRTPIVWQPSAVIPPFASMSLASCCERPGRAARVVAFAQGQRRRHGSGSDCAADSPAAPAELDAGLAGRGRAPPPSFAAVQPPQRGRQVLGPNLKSFLAGDQRTAGLTLKFSDQAARSIG